MERETFLQFVSRVDWRFAKSIPNWPHFYIVEENLPDQAAFRAARAFVRESGYAGKFFDLDVLYFDADGWTYWASPLPKPPDSQYMLNRCKTEYTYESLAKSGGLPPEGFRGTNLSLDPILEDPEFRSLVRDPKGREMFEQQRIILSRHPKTFHSLTYLLDEEYIRRRCSEVEFNLLKSILTADVR